MKNHKVCPKCAGTDIRRAEGKVFRGGGGNNIQLGMLSSPVPVHRYICCSCGYAEEWVDEEDLVKLRVYLESQLTTPPSFALQMTPPLAQGRL